ncbi:Bug family tripartite tricarboxylate transporter substrate binding protein [Neoroseomonas oryzicola]|uniref:Tripartite tricarboxylate transporter substrate binding protein n=1 Tax=Neoroseomonas oryzicola TaxID=535904 RepID=A0A9X9WJ33_9PROT|nr:tripartite tricarboxylate transporter substrate binding protein [Neoroseomonas oryzicola]MBR0660343.1 tripartite tricarboxylate transporter substrate binding protein [Neoroseomonas oryzicola]NKE18369.1 tripartite tricarboxylate transporter substrate binding protein [Neoroseomonas oryzicola]
MSWALRRRIVLAGTIPALLTARAATAQAWPAQPIRLVVPFAPGGTTDLVARLVAAGLQERLGVSVIVENRAGAGATVGSEIVARSAPDGYTLVMSNIASHGISPSVYRGRVRYDAVTDFSHIALVITNPTVWVANPRAGIRTLQDAAARAKSPSGLDVATSGAGSSNHLMVVRMGQLIGKELNHIPFRGAGPAMQAVIAGQVPMMSDSLPSAASHIRQGSVIAVAMASAQRHPAFPDVPTFREQGFDLASDSWFGLSAPAGTPAPIVERIHRETMAFLAMPETRARFSELGGTPGDLTPEGYADFVRREVAAWAPLVQASGATPD